MLKHRFFQINQNLLSSTVITPSTTVITSSLAIPLSKSSHTQYNNNGNNDRSVITALNNQFSTEHLVAVPQQKNTCIGNVDLHTISKQRNTSSRDSGVHMDSEMRSNKKRTATPYVNPNNILPEVPKGSLITQKRIEHNPAMNRHFDVPENSARRRRWGEEITTTFLNRSKDVRQDKPRELPPLGVHKENMKRISRNEAAQFYLSSARYSPLTSGKRSGDSYKMVGFGSSAPRFVANSKSPNQTSLTRNFNSQAAGLKGVRINPFSKKETPQVNSVPRLVQHHALPSWLKFTSSRSGQYMHV